MLHKMVKKNGYWSRLETGKGRVDLVVLKRRDWFKLE